MNDILDAAALKAFADRAPEKFERLAYQHLISQLRPYHTCFDESVLLTFIQKGIQQAQGIGLKSNGEIFDFITLQMFYGSEFLSDPQYGWMEKHRLAAQKNPPLFTVAVMHDAQQYQYLTGLEPHEWQILANQLLAWLEQCPKEPDPTANAMALQENVLTKLPVLWEKRAKWIRVTEIEALNQVLQDGMRHYGIISPCYQLGYFMLALILGYRFDKDPLKSIYQPILIEQLTEREKILGLMQIFNQQIQCFNRVAQNKDSQS